MDNDFLPADLQPMGLVCRRNAVRRPEAVAIIEAERTTTWSALDRYASQVANGLLSMSVKRGQHIAVIGRSNAKMFEIMHGTAWVGAIFLPINWRLAPTEIEHILRDCRAEVLFVTAAMWKTLRPSRHQFAMLRHVIVLDDEPAEGCIAYVTWRDAQDSTPIDRDIDPSEVFVQLYTSGTTGRPKGAMLSHRYFMAIGTMFEEETDIYRMKEGEEILHYMPLFHLSGIAAHYYPAVRGCGIVVLPEFETGEVLRLIRQHRVPVLAGVPSMFQAMLTDPAMTRSNLSSVRYCLYGAAPMPPVLRDRLMAILDCLFVQQYAMTEAGYVTCLKPDDHLGDAKKAASVGRPVPGVQIKIVDSEGNEVPVGHLGEIAVRTPAMMEGYWNSPDATRAVFREGWYLTGDGGYIDNDGYLYLKDRIKDLIISGGENIYPAEIENILSRHPSLSAVAVVGVPDERWGEVPKAFVVIRPGQHLSAEHLHDFASKSLGRYKLPKYYEAIDELPLNASGKLLRYELRKRSNATATKV